MIERRLVGGEAREARWASHPGLGFTVRLEDYREPPPAALRKACRAMAGAERPPDTLWGPHTFLSPQQTWWAEGREGE